LCHIGNISVLPVCFRNVTSQVPDPGWIVVIWTKASCCVPNSNYVHIPIVAREQDFFDDPKGLLGEVGIVEGGYRANKLMCNVDPPCGKLTELNLLSGQ